MKTLNKLTQFKPWILRIIRHNLLHEIYLAQIDINNQKTFPGTFENVNEFDTYRIRVETTINTLPHIFIFQDNFNYKVMINDCRCIDLFFDGKYKRCDFIVLYD